MNKYIFATLITVTLTFAACTTNTTPTPEASTAPNATASPTPASVSELRASDSADIKTWKSYTSKTGAFSIKYPADYKLMENKTVSVDGVYPDAPNSTLLVSPVIGNTTNFALTIHFAKTNKTILEDAKNELSKCVFTTENKGSNITINNKPGMQYIDSPCGANNTTEIYLLNNGIAYKLNIDYSTVYADVKADVEKVLSTMQFSK